MTDAPAKMVDGKRVPLEGAELADFLARLNAPPPPPPVPAEISDRQFAQQLAIMKVITEDEAIGWAARGDLPAALEGAIAALPEQAQFSARMLLSSATIYRRDHPLTGALGALLGRDSAQLDQIWRDAASL